MLLSDLLSKLEILNLPKDQFVIVSSGPMAAKNIREARDLDILVTDELWNHLKEKYPVKKVGVVNKVELEDIDIVGEGSVFRDDSVATMDEIFKTAFEVDGIKFLDLNLLKKFKQKMGRDKDKVDVELINKYLLENADK
jgi:hypothetical protein